MSAPLISLACLLGVIGVAIGRWIAGHPPDHSDRFAAVILAVGMAVLASDLAFGWMAP